MLYYNAAENFQHTGLFAGTKSAAVDTIAGMGSTVAVSRTAKGMERDTCN